MMENKRNDLIDRLVGNNLSNKEKQTSWITVKQENNSQMTITSHRVSEVRYKIYILFLILVGFLWITNYLLPSYKDYTRMNDKLFQIQGQTSLFETKKMKFLSDSAIIVAIDKNEENIIEYFNGKKSSNDIPPNILSNSGLVKSYLQLSNLYHPKMPINEIVILANINEYLLKKWERTKNGRLNKIQIWESEIFNSEHLYHLPISLDVSFENKDWLFSFINNVEKFILPDEEYRILYKINEISYDIVEYQEEQDVKIDLSAYYFR